MVSPTYQTRRDELEHYFDRTASDAWAKLTSDAPVSRIRATVREGRTRMRGSLLGYLPEDLRGLRILDAGCGTGNLALEVANRGAEVVAIDISPTLVALAHERIGDAGGRITWKVGDMLDPALGRFDWVVAMDSLIHYEADALTEMVAQLASRADGGLAITFAPRTTLLAIMHTVGKVFPRGDRSPDIVPIAEASFRARLANHPTLETFEIGRTTRIDASFYISQALELCRR